MSKITVIENPNEMRDFSRKSRSSGKVLGFIPTMGYLHQGHLSLIQIAQQNAEIVVASIFVNPTQFNNPEDLKKYPRDIPRDLALLESGGVAAVYLPTPETMYSQSFQTWTEVLELQKPLEGQHRPGHFRGVSTVVSMLFHIVEPDLAVFGEKDFQQLRLIEQMVEDQKFGIKIIRGTTLREADGLAMSSRNVRLSPDERQRATAISRGLFRAQAEYKKGTKEVAKLCDLVSAELTEARFIIDYVAIVDEQSLASQTQANNRSRLLVAANLGPVRLIDNLRLAS